MRYQKRFIVLAIILLLSAVFKFNTFGKEFEEVDDFRGANIQPEVFHPLMAKTINEKNLILTINNREYNNRTSAIYVNDALVMMVPMEVLRDSLNCSTHIYNKDTLLIEKKETRILMKLKEKKMQVEENETLSVKIKAPMIERDGSFFVPIKEFADYLKFTYSFSIEENKAVTLDDSEDTSFLPYAYDLRERGRMSTVKNQGSFGTCWAFASLSALESSLLPEEESEFSPDHMSLRNSFSSDQNSGGEYTMGMAYLAAWQGPVREKDDPYGDQKSPAGIAPVKHVQEMQILPAKDFDQIKEAVFKYGGVQTSIYNALTSAGSSSSYYNETYDAYCYQGEEKPNHDIVIIGWDDNFPKERFHASLEGDGAFICQNSWGKEFGEDGVFYISYYDTNVGIHNISYRKVEKNTNYDHIYQSDLCGWVGQLGYNRNSIYAANVYRAKGTEELDAVGFYATGTDTEYEIYVTTEFKNTDSLKEGRLIGKGILKNSGYYTIPLNRVINLTKGKKYAVILHLTTPGSKRPLAVEYASGEMTVDVDLSDGQGYISAKGKKWERAEKLHDCNLCIKAYTSNR
ncbi:MAG: lectin like domain-containing protein [Lachnospiraceae bacterium]